MAKKKEPIKKDTEMKADNKKSVNEKPKPAMENVKLWQSIAVVLAFVAIAAMLLAGSGGSNTCPTTPAAGQECPTVQEPTGTVSKDDAATASMSFINDYLLAGQGVTATLESVKESNGLYELNVTVSGQNSVVFTSKDGKLLFLGGIDMAQAAAEMDAQPAANDTTTKTPPSVDVPTADVPNVELFVMSYCPYGTQIEKGMIPVMQTLGNTANIQVKFVDYAMHGEKEVYENVRQYCIEKDTPDKYVDYLSCFLEAGDAKGCITKTGLSESDIQSCMDATDAKYNVTTIFNDKASWGGTYPPFMIYKAENDLYGVRGSPTLVINGKTVSSARDSQTLLNTICASFTTKPEACNTDLSSEPNPAPGFGYTAASTTASANCGT